MCRLTDSQKQNPQKPAIRGGLGSFRDKKFAAMNASPVLNLSPVAALSAFLSIPGAPIRSGSLAGG
jgi:hypothetical protein